jgi:hypothetical protein
MIQSNPISEVVKLDDVVVFTINNHSLTPDAIYMARDAGSECLIRGWFKWNGGQYWDPSLPPVAHSFGALFGGGITCSVIYEGENGLAREQVVDMATRDAEGRLVLWPPNQKVPGPVAYHGTLSNPRYLDYLVSQVQAQIDAGIDTLFMDEHHAALLPNEGYDDYSLADFRQYLLQDCEATKSWAADDARWTSQFRIDLKDPGICPDGSISSFDYRRYLQAQDSVQSPSAAANPLARHWSDFRNWRDQRAWKFLVDETRDYGRKKKRTVAICANGLVPYADFQVTNSWKEDEEMARTRDLDLAYNGIHTWRPQVTAARKIAGRKVPFVVFHDWGADLPWAALSPERQNLWMRIRGAEIYAAGGFFAFPVRCKHMRDAPENGTMETIVQQTRFYRAHRDLYLQGRYLSSNRALGQHPHLSLAIWASEDGKTILLHIVNRNRRGDLPEVQNQVTVTLPLNERPRMHDAVSPDWKGARPVFCAKAKSGLEVRVDGLQAYAVVRLRFASPVDIRSLRDDDADGKSNIT